MTTVHATSTYEGDTTRLTLAELVEHTGGQLLPLVGNASPQTTDPSTSFCSGAAPPIEAVAGEVTLVDQAKNIDAVRGCQALVVITPIEITAEQIGNEGPAWQLVTADPHAAFTNIILHFRPPMEQSVPGTGVHSSAQIHPSVQLSSGASIGAGVKIGPGSQIHAGVSIAAGCTVGANCVLHPGVTLYSFTQLGDRVVLHAGTVIGAHGFGYRNIEGKHVPTAQLGYVKIENDVEVGAAVTIDRGTYGATLIGEGTKIDNQVMIAHNCQIGKHNLICSQVGVAGSCSTGDYVVLAGQVGLKDHIALSDNVVVCAQSGVMDDLSAGVYMGSPATLLREEMQVVAGQRRLPEMRRELKKLKQQVEALTQMAERSLGMAASDDQITTDQTTETPTVAKHTKAA
ncbi:UDP-3-O-[3-hydroxymyristoyl] glucosamine N-acyltransferase [Neorhodopirellula lusitana]|uniref:UDP-3-O-acylglucosamine N-acyltransferase n=1 Tax=Neorhodopirellula lusitana TaxID=445327 RepID=A0ABY1QSI6_9BACT|nr:UDP-3-O-(3-hydroxymyristoyl)glucosamine N-acyltransferase [Neorhodopirellula lusitana]SMP78040.1 UDP-3-O-[3-hydroxymyristoyl] glucosamine N-acyltransferase [Neorhodopirellula lusitana]